MLVGSRKRIALSVISYAASECVMTKSGSASGGGIGVLGRLGVVFVVLKLCEVIDWSWWWVTAPFWFIPAIFIVVFGMIATSIGTAVIVGKATGKKNFRSR